MYSILLLFAISMQWMVILLLVEERRTRTRQCTTFLLHWIKGRLHIRNLGGVIANTLVPNITFTTFISASRNFIVTRTMQTLQPKLAV